MLKKPIAIICNDSFIVKLNLKKGDNMSLNEEEKKELKKSMQKQIYICFRYSAENCAEWGIYNSVLSSNKEEDIHNWLKSEKCRVFKFPQMTEVTESNISIK